jgi:STIP1 family protein 1
MRDPVVTDTGQSYEREVIEQHILRNGKTDPITREPITGRLYPNLALKKAIGDFI